MPPTLGHSLSPLHHLWNTCHLNFLTHNLSLLLYRLPSLTLPSCQTSVNSLHILLKFLHPSCYLIFALTPQNGKAQQTFLGILNGFKLSQDANFLIHRQRQIIDLVCFTGILTTFFIQTSWCPTTWISSLTSAFFPTPENHSIISLISSLSVSSFSSWYIQLHS